ncbi:MAG: FkbM family methyltransferase, partial [Dokdonella sp.]
VYADWPAINEPRLALLGEMERDDLVALLGGATVVLLPITTGGGSNLKTAEAIYSGRRVLATPHALRGYGDATRWPTIAIADTPAAFRRKLRALLDDDPLVLPADYERMRSEITWERALQPLDNAIAGVLVRRRGVTSASFASPPSRPPTQLFLERFVEIQRAVASSRIDYEALLEFQYRKFIRAGDTVVDVGAHTGRHLAKFLTCIGAGGRLIAFEPLPYAHAILSKAFSAANVTLHKIALTDTVGNLEFVYAEGSPEESGLRERIYNDPSLVKPRRIQVVADTLDRHADALNGLSFIKIDVEGAEMNVLRGARHVLDRYRPIVSVEYGRPAYSVYGNEMFTLFDFAEASGFAMYDLFGNRLDREAWAIACDSIYWDFFMVPYEKEADFAQRVPPVDPRRM